jgi:hypothetical protein
MTEPSLFVLLDFASSPEIRTAKARANRLLTACDKYMQLHGDQHLTVFVSKALAEAGKALAEMTDPKNIMVIEHARFRGLQCGVQGEGG